MNSPYMPRLLKEILAWDYLDLLLKDRARSGPRKVKTDFHLDFQKRLRKIPLKFPDADSFQDCFEALLLEVSGVVQPLRRRAQTGQSPTTGFKHASKLAAVRH